MSRIAKRAFGSPLSGEIVRKLQLIEELGSGDIFESQNVESEDIEEITFGGQGFYSSKTPFARMWTAVSVLELTDNKTPIDPTTVTEGSLNFFDNVYYYDNSDEDNPLIAESVIRTPSDSAGKIYVLGAYNTREGDRGILDSQSETAAIDSLIPSQRQDYTDRDFDEDITRLRPPAGITSVRSTTQNAQGPLSGVIKTTVEFVVYDFEEFESIYSRYFLRPGARLFVDFGWTNKKNFSLYNPEDLLKRDEDDRGTYNEIIYGKTSDTVGNDDTPGQLQESDYDIQFVQGYVTNVRSDLDASTGAWNCSVDILSGNAMIANPSLLEDGQTGDSKLNILKNLDYEIIKEAANSLFPEGTFRPNKSFTTEDEEEYKKIIDEFASEFLGSPDFNLPTLLNNQFGIFWKGTYKDGDENKKIPITGPDAVYVSYGYFEDVIINGEFASYFKTTDEDSDTVSDSITYDSSNAFTSYHQSLIARQRFMRDGFRNLPFILPDDKVGWGDTFNTRKNKTPSIDWNEDKKNGLIPIREVYIQLKVIKDAIKKAETLDEVFKYIRNVIKDSSGGAMFWIMESKDKAGLTRGFADLNVPNKIIQELESTQKDEQFYDNLYEFKVFGQKSLIKNMGISMNLGGSDLIGSKLALTGLGSNSNVFPSSEIIEEMQAVNLIENADDYQIEFVPSEHGSRLEKLIIKDVKAAAGSDANNSEPTYLASTNIYSGQSFDVNQKSSGTSYNSIIEKLSAINTKTGDTRVEPTDSPTKNQEEAKIKTEALGFVFADTIYEYFTHQLITEEVKTRPTILPFDVNLSLHGINAFQPGDIFKVSFIPKRFREQVFFQVWSVGQSVSAGDFTTDLQCKMRFRDDVKTFKYEKYLDLIESNKKVVTPYCLKNEFKLPGIDKILPFLKYVKPMVDNNNDESKKYDYLFKIDTCLSGESKNITEVIDITFNTNTTEGSLAAQKTPQLIKVPSNVKLNYEISSDKTATLVKSYKFEEDTQYFIFIKNNKWIISDSQSFSADTFFEPIEKLKTSK